MITTCEGDRQVLWEARGLRALTEGGNGGHGSRRCVAVLEMMFATKEAGGDTHLAREFVFTSDLLQRHGGLSALATKVHDPMVGNDFPDAAVTVLDVTIEDRGHPLP